MGIEGLDEDDIKKKVGSFYFDNVPGNYMDAMKKAFDKNELGDSLYYHVGNLSENLKKLEHEASKDTFKTYRHALRRKAATIMLEKVGFQDGWRTGDPAAPDRNLAEASISNNDNWTAYVNSLSAFPQYKPKETKWRKGWLDPFREHEDDIKPNKIWKVLGENKVWENKKAGSVLFTANGSTYRLGEGIAAVPAPPANIDGSRVVPTDPLDHMSGDDVKKAVNEIKDALKKL
jgi:hypothetical protein